MIYKLRDVAGCRGCSQDKSQVCGSIALIAGQEPWIPIGRRKGDEMK
jgi:hypothetical protein